MSTAPEGQPAATPPPDPPASQAGESDDARLDSLEAKVAAQDGKLNAILAKLPGGGAAPAAGSTAEPAADESIAARVKAGVEALRAADADTAAKAKQQSDAAEWQQSVEKRLAEREAPPATDRPGPVRAAVQRWGLGIKEPSR